MIIMQIIKNGLLPEHLFPFIKNVKSFAERAGIDYEIITSVDIDFKIIPCNGNHDPSNAYLHARTWSELVRLKYLSEIPDCLYIDWDIFLYSCFPLPKVETISYQIDDMIFNANNTDRYKKIYEAAIKKEWKAGDIISGPALKAEPDFKNIGKWDQDTYRHIFNAHHFYSARTNLKTISQKGE